MRFIVLPDTREREKSAHAIQLILARAVKLMESESDSDRARGVALHEVGVDAWNEHVRRFIKPLN